MLLLVFYYCICFFLCCCYSFNPSLCHWSPFLLSYVTVSRSCRLSEFDPNTEMPTPGDLKSGDCLFFTTPPPPGIILTEPPPPPKNWPSPQLEWLRTLYDVLRDVHTIKIQNHHLDARNNLCQWLNTCKNAPETVLQIRKIQVLS